MVIGMKALITGASSGIGREFAIELSNLGYDLILVARRKTRLEKLKKELKTNVEIIVLDISSTYNCMKLYNQLKKEKIDILINNAGFGLYGKFDETKLDSELDMIDSRIYQFEKLQAEIAPGSVNEQRMYSLDGAHVYRPSFEK